MRRSKRLFPQATPSQASTSADRERPPVKGGVRSGSYCVLSSCSYVSLEVQQRECVLDKQDQSSIRPEHETRQTEPVAPSRLGVIRRHFGRGSRPPETRRGRTASPEKAKLGRPRERRA